MNRRSPKGLRETIENLHSVHSGRMDPNDREDNEVSTYDLENAIHYLEELERIRWVEGGEQK